MNKLLEAILKIIPHPLPQVDQDRFEFFDPGILLDDDLSLVLVDRSTGNFAMNHSPIYHFKMQNSKNQVEMGRIELRLGDHPQVTHYYGHIGYRVYPEYRGRHYAARACNLLLPLARKHGMDILWITCNPDNIASRKTCQSLGAELVEIVDVPPTMDLYRAGERQKCRYRLRL